MGTSANLRTYVIEDASNGNVAKIRALAVKEKEFVVSTIDKGTLAAKIATKAATGLSFPCKVGQQITESALVAYVTAFEVAHLKESTRQTTVFTYVAP